MRERARGFSLFFFLSPRCLQVVSLATWVSSSRQGFHSFGCAQRRLARHQRCPSLLLQPRAQRLGLHLAAAAALHSRYLSVQCTSQTSSWTSRCSRTTVSRRLTNMPRGSLLTRRTRLLSRSRSHELATAFHIPSIRGQSTSDTVTRSRRASSSSSACVDSRTPAVTANRSSDLARSQPHFIPFLSSRCRTT